MGLIEKMKERFFGAAISAAVEAQVAEKLQAAAVSVPDDQKGWTRLTGDSNRSLLPVTHDRMIEIAYWTWKNNPLGNFLIEIVAEFVVGEGFTIEAKNDIIKKLLNDFWKHPINNFPVYIKKHTRELGIYGSLCLPKFVLAGTGKMAIGYVDPARIKKVIVDPKNVKMVISVIEKSADGSDRVKYKTVLDPEVEDFLSPQAKSIRDSCNGECFYFAINNVTNDPLGTSDLFVVADWLNVYEEFLFDMAEKATLLNSFIWDLMVKNGNKLSIDEQVKQITKKAGSIFGHNESVTLEAKAPDTKSFDAEKNAQLIRNQILSAKAIPTFWYGGAQDSNLAVSQEMSAPTYKMLNDRQLEVTGIVRAILDEVIREADEHNMLGGVPENERGYKINTPPLANKDITKYAAAINQLASSLVQAAGQEWIDKETAAKSFLFGLSLLGYEVDWETVEALLLKENEDGGPAAKDYKGKDKVPNLPPPPAPGTGGALPGGPEGVNPV
jgi:hypothetical protein